MQRASCLAVLVVAAASSAAAQAWRFDFGNGAVAPDCLPVTAETTFDATRGYGLHAGESLAFVDCAGPDPLRCDFITGEAPFRFNISVPREGNWASLMPVGAR